MPFSNHDSVRLNYLTNGARGSKVYPSLATTPTFTTSATAWTLGDFTELVPANAISKPFEIAYASFASISASSTYEFVFYAGAIGQEIEIGRVRFIRSGTTGDAVLAMPIHSKILDAGTRISCKVACGATGTNVCIASIIYFTYE